MKNKVHESLSNMHHQKEQNKLVFLSLGDVAAPQLVYSVKTCLSQHKVHPPHEQKSYGLHTFFVPRTAQALCEKITSTILLITTQLQGVSIFVCHPNEWSFIYCLLHEVGGTLVLHSDRHISPVRKTGCPAMKSCQHQGRDNASSFR